MKFPSFIRCASVGPTGAAAAVEGGQPGAPGRWRALFAGSFLGVTLLVTLPRASRAENAIEYKYQDYRETGDRIRVEAHYGEVRFDLGTQTSMRARGVIDTISGATPTGQPPPAGSDEVPLAELEDVRRAFVGGVSHVWKENTFALEYVHSKEDDYVSNGYSGTYRRSFNQKNTEVQVGFAYNDDSVEPSFFAEARPKLSRDFIIGVTQLLDRNTTLTVNLVHGTADGYLSDPYKIVQKTVELLPGLPLALTFPENRPTSRSKTLVFGELSRYFENLRGSAVSSLRYSSDSHSIESFTWELAWYQKFGDRVIIRPEFRYYAQTEASYYYPDLDATPIVPVSDPDGSAPHYSSDYRLSEFDAITYGIKAIYRHDDRWSFDIGYQRYDMRGRDGVTADSAYPAANILNIGASVWF